MVGEVLISKLVVVFSTWLASKLRLVDEMIGVGSFIVQGAAANLGEIIGCKQTFQEVWEQSPKNMTFFLGTKCGFYDLPHINLNKNDIFDTISCYF